MDGNASPAGRRLAGKTAIVTGASSGVGSATTRALIADGATVIAVARRIERLEELGRSLDAGSRFRPIEADIRDPAAADRLIEAAIADGGTIDFLINNAGLSRGNLHQDMSIEDIRDILETNVFALANLTRLAIPSLREQHGHIVNISSIAGRVNNAGAALYGGSKAAVIAFAEGLRKELCQDQVRVTTIMPGLIQTEFFDGFDEEKRAKLQEMAAMTEALSPEDVADSVIYAITRRRSVSINEIVIRPTLQAF